MYVPGYTITTKKIESFLFVEKDFNLLEIDFVLVQVVLNTPDTEGCILLF